MAKVKDVARIAVDINRRPFDVVECNHFTIACSIDRKFGPGTQEAGGLLVQGGEGREPKRFDDEHYIIRVSGQVNHCPSLVTSNRLLRERQLFGQCMSTPDNSIATTLCGHGLPTGIRVISGHSRSAPSDV